MDEEVQVRALNGVSLEIEKGAFIATMGPSGSGKSTLMHILGGLDRPSTGTIRVGDMNINTLDEHEIAIYRRKMVGFIFQTFNLIPSMNALENVALPLRLNGVSRKDRNERARQLLKMWGLKTGSTTAQHSSPVASSSASPLPAPWPMILPSSWRMSLPGTWIQKAALSS